MIKSIFGIGRSKDARICVAEATKDFRNPKLVFFFSGEKRFPEYAQIISEHFPNTICIGCSSYRVWDSTGTEKDILKAVAIEEGIVCSADVIEKADNFALSNMDRVKACLDQVKTKENTICVEFTIPFKRTEEYALMTLNSVLLRNEIPVIGGTAANMEADAHTSEEAYVSLNGKIYTAGCVFVIMHNIEGAIFLYKENIYEPLTGKEFTVTKANSITRTVMTYNDQPAAEVYSQELGVPISEIKKYFFHFPVGRRVGSDLFLTAIQDEGSNRSMKHLARVYEGTKMMVMKEGDYRTITAQTIEKIKRERGNPALVLMFNCVARTILFEENGYIDEYQSMLAKAFPNFIGCSCLGEQLGTKHFNHTMMIAVFE